MLACIVLTLILSGFFALDLRDYFVRTKGPTDFAQLYQQWTLLGVLTVATVIGWVVLGKATAHRLAGPQIAIKNACNEIQAGSLKARVHFREYDHLDDVEQAFNCMMDTLQARIEGKSEPAQG